MAANTIKDSVEVWEAIPGWDGYEASSLGRIRSITKVLKQRNQWGCVSGITYPGKIRAQSRCKATQYFKVGLSNVQDGRRRTCAVHRLICETFHGTAPVGKTVVAHCNGDRGDNRAVNLRWATPKENSADCLLHGTSNKGERNGAAKLTDAQFQEIMKRVSRGEGVQTLAIEYGIADSSLYQRLRRYRTRKAE